MCVVVGCVSVRGVVRLPVLWWGRAWDLRGMVSPLVRWVWCVMVAVGGWFGVGGSRCVAGGPVGCGLCVRSLNLGLGPLGRCRLPVVAVWVWLGRVCVCFWDVGRGGGGGGGGGSDVGCVFRRCAGIVCLVALLLCGDVPGGPGVVVAAACVVLVLVVVGVGCFSHWLY